MSSSSSNSNANDAHQKQQRHPQKKNRFIFAYKRATLRAEREIKRKGKEIETRVRSAFKIGNGSKDDAGERSDRRKRFFGGKTTDDGNRADSKKDFFFFEKARKNVSERAIDPIKRSANELKENVRKNFNMGSRNEQKRKKSKAVSSSSSRDGGSDAAATTTSESFSKAKAEVPLSSSTTTSKKSAFVLLETERKRMEEKWKEVWEKMKKERTTTTTTTTTTTSASTSSSAADSRKHQKREEEQQKRNDKKKNGSKESKENSSSLIKTKVENAKKEVSLKLNENVRKVNAAIEARKKEAEEAFASARGRVMAMTVKKEASRDDGKNKNKRQENKKSSTSANNSSSSSSRHSENKKKTTGEEAPPANIFERSKSVASDFVGTATASMEDVKVNIDSVQKTVAKKLSDMQLRENFEGTTQNIARESKKLVTEDLPSTIKTLSKESVNLTGSALKELNDNIDVDAIAQNAKKSLEDTSKTVETLIRDVHSNASIAAASGKALVTDLIDPPEKLHRVRKGESLLKIARKYGVSVVDVCRVNNLAPTDENPHFVAIKIGQILNIPNPDRMAEQPAYENSKFDEKYESTVNAYYEQRLNSSSSSKKKLAGVASSSSEGASTSQGLVVQRVSIAKPTTSGNAKLAGSFALLATAAAISYLRAGLDDDDDDGGGGGGNNNDGGNPQRRDDSTNASQML